MHIRSTISCCNTTASGNTTMDTIYPEPMSLLHRRVVPKKRRGNTHRYRTQPITFSEIQEVDEENIEESPSEVTAAVSSRSEQNLNQRFEEFMKDRENFLRQIEKSITTVDENLNATSLPSKETDDSATTMAQSDRFTSTRPSI